MKNEKPGGHGERSTAVGVIDMAVWDIVSKIEQVPLYEHLAKKYGNGKFTNKIFVYAAGGYYYPGKEIQLLQDEMKGYGIPASITLAQGILESGMGFGRLAVEGNNHFGIKCHSDWTGKRIYHDDDRKGECFRVYIDPVTSYRDHSLFLKSRSRYSLLFEIKTTNYKAWARGLKKAGYATDPKYPDKLISLIERFDLTRYDSKKSDSLILKSQPNKEKTSQIHKVQKGDTLYSVSRQYDIPIEKLIKINQISNKTIYLGQELKISTKN